MPTFISWLRIIRYLIPLIAFRMQKSLRQFIHLTFHVFLRKQSRMPAFLPNLLIFRKTFIKRCTFLNNQTVCRNMLRAQSCHFLQRILPAFQCLSRQRRHQIHIDIFKPGFSCQIITFQKLRKIVDSPQKLQFSVIRGL